MSNQMIIEPNFLSVVGEPKFNAPKFKGQNSRSSQNAEVIKVQAIKGKS